MSDVMDDLVVSYPKTVTACHAEIIRLERLLTSATDNLEQRDGELHDAEERVDELEEAAKTAEVAAADAINALLDECERVGPLRYDVPQTDRAMRAIVQLHDAVGRNA